MLVQPFSWHRLGKDAKLREYKYRKRGHVQNSLKGEYAGVKKVIEFSLQLLGFVCIRSFDRGSYRGTRSQQPLGDSVWDVVRLR